MIRQLDALGVRLVCPGCRGELAEQASTLECRQCSKTFPVVSGIADLRLFPDRFLSIEQDRAKGLAAVEQSKGRGFRSALDAYWAMTPELDPALAAHHIRRQLGEIEVGRAMLEELGAIEGPLLDVGCGSGGLLGAAGERGASIVGVDAAFRWLLIGRERLREMGLDPPLVCANAEALPFADGAFKSACANDLLEHLLRQPAAMAEMQRILSVGGSVYVGTNNRYSLLPEPHVRLIGVGWLPRAWQAGYVRALRRHDYKRVRLLGAGELRRLAEQAGLEVESVRAAPVYAPHLEGLSRGLAKISNALPWPAAVAPRIALRARKPAAVG